MSLRPLARSSVCALPTLIAATALTCAALGAFAAEPTAVKAKAKAGKTARAAAVAPALVEPPVTDATPEQVLAAEKVYYGLYDCEFQQNVHIQQNPKHSAYVDVKAGKSTWLMKPVLSSTGAIRLEDVKGETLMVQISSKSMLLNVKTARRIVDDCISPRQRELIEEAKLAKAAAATASASANAGNAASPEASALLRPAAAMAPATATATAPTAAATPTTTATPPAAATPAAAASAPAA